jgi:hypothetical protein
MNNVRMPDNTTRCWLEVTVDAETDHNYTVSSVLFEGTPFSIAAPKAKVEVNPTDPKKGLLEVGKVGTGFGYVEVVLPAPSLRFGFQARVLETQLVNPAPKVTTGTKYKVVD